MEGVNVRKEDAVWRRTRTREKGKGMILGEYGIDDILRFLNKKGYHSYEALELRKEIEQSKQKYDGLIEKQSNMPGKDKAAEAVIKYYLFQLEKLKRDLPYDAMGCESTVPLLVLQEFQKESIAEEISEFLGISGDPVKEELISEAHKFVTFHLDPRGKALYMELMKNGQGNLDEHL